MFREFSSAVNAGDQTKHYAISHRMIQTIPEGRFQVCLHQTAMTGSFADMLRWRISMWHARKPRVFELLCLVLYYSLVLYVAL
jgi:hypothetical protein